MNAKVGDFMIKKISDDNYQILQEGDLAEMVVDEVGKSCLWLDAGRGKRIALPFKKVRGEVEPGDDIVVGIYKDKKGYLSATMILGEVIELNTIPALGLKRGDQVIGEVYNITSIGVFILTQERYIGFIHESELTMPLKVGNKVSARVTFVREDGRLNLSMRPLKEVGQVVDAEIILEYLKNRQGMMPYSDESTPEVIQDKFNISKKAFKRALGKLLKDGKIYQEKGWTYLKKGEV